MPKTNRSFAIFVCGFAPLVASAQITLTHVRYQVSAFARSGASNQTVNSGIINQSNPPSNDFHRRDAFANSAPSTVNSWASVQWLQPDQWSLGTTLEACWNSVDAGAGNSCDVLASLRLEFLVAAPTVMTTTFVSTPPEQQVFERFTGTTYVPNSNLYAPHVNSLVSLTDTRLWNAGYYRFFAQRRFIRQGNSTFCIPMSAYVSGVPEPGSALALGLGAALCLRRRRR